MKNIHRGWAVAALLAGLGLASAASARVCERLPQAVDEARAQLQKATMEADLDSARQQSLRASSALDQAALVAMDCRCTQAFTEFDDAAIRARKARNAGSIDELNDSLNRSVRSFNAAIGALSRCR